AQYTLRMSGRPLCARRYPDRVRTAASRFSWLLTHLQIADSSSSERPHHAIGTVIDKPLNSLVSSNFVHAASRREIGAVFEERVCLSVREYLDSARKADTVRHGFAPLLIDDRVRKYSIVVVVFEHLFPQHSAVGIHQHAHAPTLRKRARRGRGAV